MRVGIAVFNKHWVDAAPLFRFLDAFGVKIKNQDTYGDRKHEIKNTHLVVDGNEAHWVDTEGFEVFINSEFCTLVHYDSLIHNVKASARADKA
jgi:hypothetical protein